VRTFAYFAVAIALCAFGVVGILSIGAPFLLTGATMLIVSPWRTRRSVLWPALAAPWAFTVTYVLLAPLTCSSSSTIGPLLPRTDCTNVLGIDYSGVGAYQPPLLPAFAAGVVVALLVSFALRRLLARNDAAT
jgi:hypothetical protein